MTAEQGISKYGFRDWYERELIICHGYLVVGLLCFVLVMMLVEQLDWRGPWLLTLLMVAAVALATVLGGIAFRRYLHILGSVVALADKCVCAQCGTYGRVRVVAAGHAQPGATAQWLRLQCRQCSHEWQVISQLP